MRRFMLALLALVFCGFAAPAFAACTPTGNTSGTDSAAIVANTYGACQGSGGAATIADGGDATQGAKADAKSTATDTTPISIVSILKEVSAMLQAPPSQAVTNAGTFAAQATLQAGSAIAGKFGIDQTTPGTTDSVSVKTGGYSTATSLTRTNDTNVYAANDVVGAATGSTAGLTFAVGPSGGGEVMITSVALEIDATGIISGETSYRLYLYSVTPPSALGDNAAWDLPAGDRASYLGYVDLGTIVDLGSTLYVQTDGLNKQVKLANGNIFGYLVTIGGYTPTASRVHVITVHSVAM